MKILMVNPNVAVGGAQKIMLYLAKGLQQRGHQVVIYTTAVDHANLPSWTRRLTYHVEPVPILRAGGELANFTSINNLPLLAARLVRLRRGLARAVRRYAIDVVNPVNPPANWLCGGLRVPSVWSCHNNPMAFFKNLKPGYSPLWPSKDRPHHRLMEWGYEQLDHALVQGLTSIVSLSDRIAAGIQQVYGRSSEVIPFALSDDDGILAATAPANGKFAHMEREGLRMIQVGQLVADKRPHDSLDVLERVRARIPNARLTYVGDGTLRVALEQEVKRRGLQTHVEFLGFKNERELAPVYAAAHVLLFPGAEQPYGLVPLEAIWQSVVPVVAVSSGVTSLLARHGLTTVAEPTAEAFAEQVLSVYSRGEAVGPWLSRIRESLQTELNYDRFLDRYEAVFAKAAGA